MVAVPVSQMVESIPLDEALAEVVVLSWNDLMPGPGSGLIHIEYHVEPPASIEFVKVWASTIRGEWNLICEYWMRPGGSRESGLRLVGKYKSAGLERMLQSVLQNRGMFLRTVCPGDHRFRSPHPQIWKELPPARETFFIAGWLPEMLFSNSEGIKCP